MAGTSAQGETSTPPFGGVLMNLFQLQINGSLTSFRGVRDNPGLFRSDRDCRACFEGFRHGHPRRRIRLSETHLMYMADCNDSKLCIGEHYFADATHHSKCGCNHEGSKFK